MILIIPHPSLISRELFEHCQEIRKKIAVKPFKNGALPFLYRGLFVCMNSGKICQNEIKKKKFQYLVCYKEDGNRLYIPEKDITDQISYILDGISIPQDMLVSLKEHLQNSKSAEIEYRNRELGRLQENITKTKNRLDALFNMCLDDEISKEDYEEKRAKLQLEIDRTTDKIKAHGKADDGFNDTLLDLFSIAYESGNLFRSDCNIERKRLLLRFLFDELKIKEGVIYYKLKMPFSQLERNTNSGGNSSEPLPSKAFSEKTPIFSTSENCLIRTAETPEKSKACDQKSQACSNWLGNLESNQDIRSQSPLFYL